VVVTSTVLHITMHMMLTWLTWLVTENEMTIDHWDLVTGLGCVENLT